MVKRDVGVSIIYKVATSYWKFTCKIIGFTEYIQKRCWEFAKISQLDENVVVVYQPTKTIKLTTDNGNSSILTKLKEITKLKEMFVLKRAFVCVTFVFLANLLLLLCAVNV